MTELVVRYPRALIIPLSHGEWVGHTRDGLVWAESLEQLGDRLAEIYDEPCPVTPQRRRDGG
ncbi:hypothetical protein [Thermomonospora amylolytica]|uniref:hypothetical protein n=1 Tax=Thermomonospora amylolytica TaxID=1411117 RepID=UPI0013002ABA|nr:hypothetical protein [Thermomonospora amylolytica]